MGLMDQAKHAASSDKGEQATDKGIDKAEDVASDKTGGKFDDKIDKAGDAADTKIGD
ncbi:antitoxin [Frondihabitans peucedani]|uniref:MT0933-like antitoxin protein n=1 Tax=Frondihabitans peucedani TaxID=598626 RepID=A0ABP8E6G5_9MICO